MLSMLCWGGPLFGESLLALALLCCDDSSFFSADGKPLGLQLSRDEVRIATRNPCSSAVISSKAMKSYKQIWRQRLAKLILASTVSGLIVGGIPGSFRVYQFAWDKFDIVWLYMWQKLLCKLWWSWWLPGLAIYYSSMVFYFHYKSAATYNSVVPSQSAESILDSWICGPLKLYPTYPPFFNWKQHSMWQQCTLRRNVYVEAVEAAILIPGVAP